MISSGSNDIAEILKALDNGKYYHHKPKYWLDYGNSQYTGQVLLSTIGDIKQPNSDIYETVANLPMVTDEFTKDLVYLMETFNQWSGSGHNVNQILSELFLSKKSMFSGRTISRWI